MSTITSISDTEQELIADLRSGSKDVFGQLYKKYAPALLGYIVKIIGDKQTAESVLEKSFKQIWKSKREYKPESGRLFTWMLRTTKEIALTFVAEKQNVNKKIGNQNSISFVNIDGNSNKKEYPDNKETNDKIGLNVLHCQVLSLVYYNKYNTKEAAAILNIEEEKLRVILRGAVNKLKELS